MRLRTYLSTERLWERFDEAVHSFALFHDLRYFVVSPWFYRVSFWDRQRIVRGTRLTLKMRALLKGKTLMKHPTFDVGVEGAIHLHVLVIGETPSVSVGRLSLTSI